MKIKVFITISAEQHPGARRLLNQISALGLEESIINVGAIPLSELESHYHKVDAILLPTLLESFSGTYIEAMHFGTPIITSDRDFSREVCGNAALYFDPTSEDDLCRVLLQFQNDHSIRNALPENGRLQLSKHSLSWNESFRFAICALEELAAHKKS